MKLFDKNNKKSLILGVAIIFAAFLFSLFIFRGSASRGLATIQKPFVRFGTWINIQTKNLLPSSELTEQISILTEQRDSLTIDYVELEQLRIENEQLQKQIGFLDRLQKQYVTAAIISRTSSNQNATFVINKGANDGITIGSPIIIGEGFMVGKVISLTSTTSTVASTTDPEAATAATLLNKSRTIGIAQGQSGRLIQLSFIPHEEEVKVNDLVVSSGLEEQVPSGLIIGIVNTVSTDSTLPFQKAIVEPLVNINHYSIVSVLIEEGI